MPATTAKSPSAQLLETQTVEYIDMRKPIDGLAALIEQKTKLNPFDARLFVFCNRRRDKVKLLYWEKNGFVLWYKRLEKFRFKWPGSDGPRAISEERLNQLLDGYDIRPRKPHPALSYTSVF